MLRRCGVSCLISQLQGLYQQGCSRTSILSFDCFTTLPSLLDQSFFIKRFLFRGFDSGIFSRTGSPVEILAVSLLGGSTETYFARSLVFASFSEDCCEFPCVYLASCLALSAGSGLCPRLLTDWSLFSRFPP